MNDDLKFFTDGAAYERLMGRWSQIAGVGFLDWLGASAGLRWLDVGCGNGAFSEVVMTRHTPSELHGIDPSDAQLDFARARGAIGNAHFRVGDAQALPFDDDVFDVATMALVISFVPDPAKAVSEMARVVRPGGWVASYMWDVPGDGLPYAPISSAIRTLGLGSQFVPPGGVYTFPELEILWRQAKIGDLDMQRIAVPVTFDDFDDFWVSSALLGSPIGKVVAALSAPDRDRLEKHLQETLPADSHRRISFDAHVNAVKGRVPVETIATCR